MKKVDNKSNQEMTPTSENFERKYWPKNKAGF